MAIRVTDGGVIGVSHFDYSHYYTFRVFQEIIQPQVGPLGVMAIGPGILAICPVEIIPSRSTWSTDRLGAPLTHLSCWPAYKHKPERGQQARKPARPAGIAWLAALSGHHHHVSRNQGNVLFQEIPRGYGLIVKGIGLFGVANLTNNDNFAG